MKQNLIITAVIITGLLTMPLVSKAQDKQQRKLHITIEEDGMVTKDTALMLSDSLSEQEIEKIINGITGDTGCTFHAHKQAHMHGKMMDHKCPGHDQKQQAMKGDITAHNCPHHQAEKPCPGHEQKQGAMHGDTTAHKCPHHQAEKPCPGHEQKQGAMHGDTTVHKCKHLQQTELDSLLDASGEETEIETIKSATPHEKISLEEHSNVAVIKEGDHTIKKTVKVVLSDGEEFEITENATDDAQPCDNHVVKKQIIITDDGKKIERTIILDNPEKSEKSKVEAK